MSHDLMKPNRLKHKFNYKKKDWLLEFDDMPLENSKPSRREYLRHGQIAWARSRQRRREQLKLEIDND